MIFQTAMSGSLGEVAYRVVRNSLTKTTTITAATAGLGQGMPVILETNTASYDGVFVAKALTATAVINNLYIGNLHWGGAVYSYLNADEVGLVQCYGVDTDAAVTMSTANLAIGSPMIPDGTVLLDVGQLVTAAATGTSAHAQVPALGGLAILMAIPTTSSVAGSTTGRVFLRCM